MWKSVKIGDVAKAVGGNGFPKKYQANTDKPIPFFKVSDMNIDGNEIEMCSANNYVDEVDLGEMKAKYHPAGTIIFPKIGGAISTNKKRILTSLAAFDNNVMGVIPNTSMILPEFLYKIFLSFDLYELSNKAALPSITNGAVEEVEILLPPLSEQQRIVAKLDAAFAEIDELAKNTEARLESAKAIFENSVKQYFSIESAQCEIKNLSEIASYFNGLTYSPKDVSEKGTLVLRSSNIQNGRMEFSDIVRVNKTIKEKLFVQPNDILICSRNGSKALIGKCSLVGEQDEPMTFGTFMMIVRGEHNNYLQWFFKSKLFKEQIAQGENTAINQITRYMLDDVVLPFPNPNIQAEIAKNLEAIDTEVRRLQVMYQNNINELNSLKSAILVQELQSEAA